ncbi:hypothetical protein PR003_g20312 [Phytophthora rubi]|uniref:Uncharacterized protein n=1 Tax=Phytophthora rubi TaxID=129364 RepID=A0A6A4DKX8_9STRA|nr:hypothetical protein PR003_g20312 [Phytophthora rubi]
MDGGVYALLVNVHFVAALAIAALLSTAPTNNDDRLETATRESEKGFNNTGEAADSSGRSRRKCRRKDRK